MGYTTITLDVADDVAHLRLNRPANANSLNAEMARDLRDAAIDMARDRSVRAVLLTGEGKVFCGGGDLASFAEQGDDLPAFIEQVTADLHVALARFAKMDAPLVAAVRGTAGGAGLSLVAACDLVVCGASSRFTMGYTKVGLVPDGSSSFYLARNIGLRRALDLVLTNRMLSAEEAEDWGLVNRVVADDEVEKVAGAMAAELAAGPTRSLGRAKRVIYAGATSALEEAMERESLSIADAADTADAREGIAAFLARRPPTFTGD